MNDHEFEVSKIMATVKSAYSQLGHAEVSLNQYEQGEVSKLGRARDEVKRASNILHDLLYRFGEVSTPAPSDE